VLFSIFKRLGNGFECCGACTHSCMHAHMRSTTYMFTQRCLVSVEIDNDADDVHTDGD